jgi:hypothetical protein
VGLFYCLNTLSIGCTNRRVLQTPHISKNRHFVAIEMIDRNTIFAQSRKDRIQDRIEEITKANIGAEQ